MWSGGRESLALLCGIPDQRQAENPYSLSRLVLGSLALPSLMASCLKALPLILPAAKVLGVWTSSGASCLHRGRVTGGRSHQALEVQCTDLSLGARSGCCRNEQ